MTGKPKTARAALDRLVNALVEDILATPDAEILKEFHESDGDPARYAAEMRARFEKNAIAANKERLAAAKAGAAAARRAAPSAPVDISEARAQISAVLAAPGVPQKLTLAARKESEMSDADILTMWEDLRDLGVLPPGRDTSGQS